MTQPRHVPLTPADRVRTGERLPTPEPWRTDRPAEAVSTSPPSGRRLGTAGPDQGYGLKLARQLVPALELGADDHTEDAVAGCLAVGLKRAAAFGRAPVVYDFQHAYTLWGFRPGAPADLVEHRRRVFAGASHDYWHQRDIADAVPESTLRLTPEQVAERLVDWRTLLTVDA